MIVKLRVLIPLLFIILLTSFSPKDYYNPTVENHIKRYVKYQTNKGVYRKILNNEVKNFLSDIVDWNRELHFLMEYNALDNRQSEYFDFNLESENKRIKITAIRKKICSSKTPLVSQTLLWDKQANKPIYIRSHVVRRTWFYEQDIESKATFEVENGKFFVKRTFQHFFSKVIFFRPKEVVIYGNFTPYS